MDYNNLAKKHQALLQRYEHLCAVLEIDPSQRIANVDDLQEHITRAEDDIRTLKLRGRPS